MFMLLVCSFFFFFNDTATTEIYTLSLHDALPIFQLSARRRREGSHRDRDAPRLEAKRRDPLVRPPQDRKSTRLNSSHSQISYAVFCLKKKKKTTHQRHCIPHTQHTTTYAHYQHWH